jgi:DNA (cytosine-5)-methyltransferase 1
MSEHRTAKSLAQRLPVIDVFSGVGGLSLGAARAGFHVRAAVELDRVLSRAHAVNFPLTTHFRRSASRLSGSDLRRLTGIGKGDVFGLLGGPPCQGFSVIGRRDASDPRNRLLVHFFRIVAEARPVFFVAENVPGILSKANEPVREEALSRVAAHYSVIGPLTVAANDYGAPTSRERVFYIGFDATRMTPLEARCFSRHARETVLVRDALAGLPVRLDPEVHTDGWRTIRVERTGPYASRLWG